MSEGKYKRYFIEHEKRIIILTILFLVAIIDFVLGSIFLPKSYVSFRSYNPHYHHGFHRNDISFGIDAGGEFPFITNSLAMRDRVSRKVALQSNKKRVLLMGDSFTEGLGLPYELTFAGYLSQLIDTANSEILNGGVASYSPKLYYLRSKYLLETEQLEVDTIVVFIDVSDIYDEFRYYNFKPGILKNYLKLAVVNIRKFFYFHSYLTYNSIDKYMRWKYSEFRGDYNMTNDFLSFYLQEVLEQVEFEPNESEEDPILQGLIIGKNNMTRLLELCKKHNISLIISVHPWPENIIKKENNHIQVRFWKEFAKVNNLKFINLFEAFVNANNDPNETLKMYNKGGDIHWNKDGHKFVADKVFEQIFESQKD